MHKMKHRRYCDGKDSGMLIRQGLMIYCSYQVRIQVRGFETYAADDSCLSSLGSACPAEKDVFTK